MISDIRASPRSLGNLHRLVVPGLKSVGRHRGGHNPRRKEQSHERCCTRGEPCPGTVAENPVLDGLVSAKLVVVGRRRYNDNACSLSLSHPGKYVAIHSKLESGRWPWPAALVDKARAVLNRTSCDPANSSEGVSTSVAPRTLWFSPQCLSVFSAAFEFRKIISNIKADPLRASASA